MINSTQALDDQISNDKMMKKFTTLFLFTFIILFSYISNSHAKNLTLQWDQNDDADYYIVYWGTDSGNYTMQSDSIGAETTEYTATDLSNTETYYFAVKAFNSCGNSSEFSDEIICTESDGAITEEDGDQNDTGTDGDQNDTGTDGDQDDTGTDGTQNDTDTGGDQNDTNTDDDQNDTDDEVFNISLTPQLQAEISSSTVQTRWQISLTPDFSTIELDVTKTTELSTLTVPRLILNGGTTYYWRVSIENSKNASSSWSSVKTFSTTADIAADDNGNGIRDDQDVDGTTDMDQNGVADYLQDDIKCVKNTTDGSQIIAVKKGENVNDIELVEFIDQNNIDDTAGMPDEMPEGLIGFKIIVDNPGDNAQVTICFSEAADENAGWYKYDSINGWVNYTSYVTFSEDRMSVTIDLVDGGFGDADGAANGVIVDPGGLGIMHSSDQSILSGSSESGGCFISSFTNTCMTANQSIIRGMIFMTLIIMAAMLRKSKK